MITPCKLGAYNTIAQLGPDERAAGVVAASAGNHGQAVAWAAREAGISATVYMPRDAPMAKVEATRSYDGAVELSGETFEDAVAAAQSHAERTGATLVHAFEDPRVIAGQGTIGLELSEQGEEAETFLVPIGGGGLAAGISTALRERRRGIRIVGVICRPGVTIADGISVKDRGELASEILDRTLDDVVEVGDEEIWTRSSSASNGRSCSWRARARSGSRPSWPGAPEARGRSRSCSPAGTSTRRR